MAGCRGALVPGPLRDSGGKPVALFVASLEVALTGHRHDLRIVEGELAGPARPVLDRAFAGAGYVVLAEEHNNRDIPDLSVALFRMLQAAHGFQYFATEQDPLALALLSQDPARGRAGAAADFVRRFPQAMPFVSDQELRMLDEIAGASRARHHPLWGIDQAYGATHYLESLLPLAPDDPLKSEVAALLESARATEARRDGDPPDAGFPAPRQPMACLHFRRASRRANPVMRTPCSRPSPPRDGSMRTSTGPPQGSPPGCSATGNARTG